MNPSPSLNSNVTLHHRTPSTNSPTILFAGDLPHQPNSSSKIGVGGEIFLTLYSGPKLPSSTIHGMPNPGFLKLWLKCVDDNLISNIQLLPGKLDAYELIERINLMCQSPLSLHLPTHNSYPRDYLFVNSNRENQVTPLQTPLQEEISTTFTPLLTIVMLKNEKTMEILRYSNREMKEILAQLRILKTDATTPEKPLNLQFTELIQEIVIVLLSLELSKLERINQPKLM